jgi:hypothetical protein
MAKMKRGKTEQELELAAQIVSWEFKHLSKAAIHYQEFKGNAERLDLGTVCFEAFLLHYRNIREFLSEPPEHDDIKAVHLCPNWALPVWPDHLHDNRASRDNRFSEKGRLDKTLTHLTFFRVELKIIQPPVSD